MSRSLYLRITLSAVAVYLVVGAFWTISNLRDIPHYGDTAVYFRNARDLRTEHFRGIVYPWLLAAAERVCLEGELPERLDWKAEEAEGPGRPCVAPRGLVWVQIFQIAVNFLCLLYFLQLVAGATARGQPVRWLLAAMLALDPLISHFNLALMADSLAFSGMLVFCASLPAFVLGRGSRWVNAVLLFISYVVVSGLRIEKRWALGITALVAVAGWLWLARRGLLVSPGSIRRRATAAVLLVGLGLVGTIAVHRAFSMPGAGWSGRETVTHFRLIFPYLEEVYDELPQRAQKQITRDDAHRYDTHVNYVRVVVNRATQYDEVRRRELTDDLLKTVLPRRWGAIAIDIVRDAAENAAATLSFYTRVGVWRIFGDAAIESWFYSDSAVWDYRRLVFHHPLLSEVYLACFGVVLVLALPLALLRAGRRARREDWRELVAEGAVWFPAVVLWIVNAAAFAAVVNITNVRYMLFSHMLFLLWIYGSALRPGAAKEGATCRSTSR